MTRPARAVEATPPASATSAPRDTGDGTRATGDGARAARGAARGWPAGSPRGAAGRWGAAAVLGLVAGSGLLVFTDAPWMHVLGVAGLLLCAVAVFALSASPLDR